MQVTNVSLPPKRNQMNNKRGMEIALGWIIGIAIVLVVLVVIVAFWRVLYNAVLALPG